MQKLIDSLAVYEKMVLVSLEAILERSERDKNYGYVDTKLSLMSGIDFNDKVEPHRGKSTVYAWIQGRGLEALAGHAQYIETLETISFEKKKNLCNRIDDLLKKVVASMEAVRAKNHGRLHFCFDREGRFLEVRNLTELHTLETMPQGSNFSELFYFKGLIAAASRLGDDELLETALVAYDKVLDSIENGTFYSDQQEFDPKKDNVYDPDMYAHGPWMIALGGIALAAAVSKKREAYLQRGEKFIRYELENHLNTGQHQNLQLYDFTEAVNAKGAPYVSKDGKILCDPGHALEFIGLALKVLLQMDDRKFADVVSACRRHLPAMFCHVQGFGFNPAAGGIVKSYDLAKREFINTDMPWWNLPETMRAGAELLVFAPESELRHQLVAGIQACSDAFIKNYLREDLHMMAYQTVNENSEPIDVIPATPDADPGYHTNLSIIDYLKCIKQVS